MPDDRRFAFEVTARSSADAATLFALEADGSRWSQWAAPLVPRSFWERHGDPAPAGVGAIRALGLPPLLMREETVGYEPDHRHAYVLRSRVPMRDYRAEVVLTARPEGGTDLVWRGSFAEIVPGSGPVLRAALRMLISVLARRLVRFAERGSA